MAPVLANPRAEHGRLGAFWESWNVTGGLRIAPPLLPKKCYKPTRVSTSQTSTWWFLWARKLLQKLLASASENIFFNGFPRFLFLESHCLERSCLVWQRCCTCRCRAACEEKISKKIDYAIDSYPVHPADFFSKAMTYQNVMRNSIKKISKLAAKQKIKDMVSLNPRRPRAKDSTGKCKTKTPGSGYIAIFCFKDFLLNRCVFIVHVTQENHFQRAESTQGYFGFRCVQLLAVFSRRTTSIPNERRPQIYRVWAWHEAWHQLAVTRSNSL